jgi:hypothetical protein
MKTILAVFLGISAMAGLASQSSAATSQPAAPHNATVNVAAADYDDPGFGTQRWWGQEGDRGG